MGLNEVPSSVRVHIGFFGMRNTGKSSLVNAVTGQELSVVSEVKGTTTDPVYKAMELLPLGPVVIIDTPGIDDEGILGTLRVHRAKQVLHKVDVAVLVVDAATGIMPEDAELIQAFIDRHIVYIVAYNKCDLLQQTPDALMSGLLVSATQGTNINALKEHIAALANTDKPGARIVGDLIEPGDFVVLVVPIDSAAPKGRLILPQQQVIRDVLECGATAVVVREFELKETLAQLGKKPKLVVTDSQAFASVSRDTPADILLTSFSILFARYKGFLDSSVEGAATLDLLDDGDRVLICEGCTHHRQCDDIGTVKLPRWLNKHTGKKLELSFTSGGTFPDDLSLYRLVIHCGGCMLSTREMIHRQRSAQEQTIPMTNYGIAIAYMHGILARSLEVFSQK
jgi:[FeFe] hydrogenase H-cluster maturation GTPase HydF